MQSNKAKMKLRIGGNFGPDTKDAIFVRDKARCVYCGYYATEEDHVIPSSLGGPSIYGNGVACCRKCNSKKKNKLKYEMITRALFYLSMKGHDIEWMDELFSPNAWGDLDEDDET